MLYSSFKLNNRQASTGRRKKSLQQNPKARSPALHGGLAEASVSAHGVPGGLQWPAKPVLSSGGQGAVCGVIHVRLEGDHQGQVAEKMEMEGSAGAVLLDPSLREGKTW